MPETINIRQQTQPSKLEGFGGEVMVASAVWVVMVAKGLRCVAWQRCGGELHVGGDDINGGVAWRWSGGCRRMMAVVWWRGCGGGGEGPRMVVIDGDVWWF
ncbi:hypothetical protein Tco_0628190 [Tanacetum coccineum]|uniref:Uncharacterized protein n=1 Tax=Tanacetum coccineum TaxID=301880 RepID=A0ABQ4WPT6_9ASTR